jgi:hypothetical protein
MKKVGEIMAEMGFRKDAPDSVKEAFLKHLIKNTTGVELETPSEKAAKTEAKNNSHDVGRAKTQAVQPVQLSFFFLQDQDPSKKVS